MVTYLTRSVDLQKAADRCLPDAPAVMADSTSFEQRGIATTSTMLLAIKVEKSGFQIRRIHCLQNCFQSDIGPNKSCVMRSKSSVISGANERDSAESRDLR
jgi:hypothetical protein